MANIEWFLTDLFLLVYNLPWLVFLTRKHYGQVTTTAGHIFELNILLNYNVSILYFILIDDLELIPLGTMKPIFDAYTEYSLLVSMVGSQIETAIFLKTLNVNTMMTSLARKVILMMAFCCFGMGIIMASVLPSSDTDTRSKTEFCEVLTPNYFYRTIIPYTVGLVIVLGVIGFALFRSHQVRDRDKSDKKELFDAEGRSETFKVSVSQDRLSPRRAIVGNAEDDIAVEEIELVIMEMETPFLSRQTEEDCETSLRNDDYNIVVEDIHTETSTVLNRDVQELFGNVIDDPTSSDKSENQQNSQKGEHCETPFENVDDIDVEESELVIMETPLLSRQTEEDCETFLRNVEYDKVVEDINTETSTVLNRDVQELFGNVIDDPTSSDKSENQQNSQTGENYETPFENVENDIIVEDLVITETSVLSRDLEEPLGNVNDDQTSLDQSESHQKDSLCLPGKHIIQTLNKYLKNTLISLVILITQVPLILTALWGFTQNLGCENQTFKFMSNFSIYFWFSSFTFLPFLIKIKLDRLSK